MVQGAVKISKVQVKDDMMRVIKDVKSGFIVVGTPQCKSQDGLKSLYCAVPQDECAQVFVC